MKNTQLFVHCVLIGIVQILVGCGVGEQIVAENNPSNENTAVVAMLTPSETGGTEQWVAAEYKSIKVGTDTRDKALTILGKPVWSGDPPNEEGIDADPEIVDTFEGVDEMYSRVNIYSSKTSGKIQLIEAQMLNLPLIEVLKRFGDSYQRKDYSFVLCVKGDSNSALLVEKPKTGDIVRFEYPSMGISIATDKDAKVVHAVEYRKEPLVASGNNCRNSRRDKSGGRR